MTLWDSLCDLHVTSLQLMSGLSLSLSLSPLIPCYAHSAVRLWLWLSVDGKGQSLAPD